MYFFITLVYASWNAWWISDLVAAFLVLCVIVLCVQGLAIDVVQRYVSLYRIYGVLTLLLIISLVYIHWWWREADVLYRVFIGGWVTLVYVSLGILLWEKYRFFCTRCRVVLWWYVLAGMPTLMLLTTLSFSLFVASSWSNRPLSCDQLYGTIDTWITTVTSPIRMWAWQLDIIRGYVDNVFTVTFGQIIGIDEEESDALEQYLSAQWSWNNKAIWSWWTIVSILDTWKLYILEQAADKTVINKWVCSLIIEHIQYRSQSPWFTTSVAVFLFFLLYPFIKFLYFLVSCISCILLWLWEKMRLYTRHMQTWEIEILE